MDPFHFRVILQGYNYPKQDYYDIDTAVNSEHEDPDLNPSNSDDESTLPLLF
jgi:hypothetical protein